MRGQASTEPDVSVGENTERAFVQQLYLWFRDSASAWVGTAAELLSELKGRADGPEGECWPENAPAICSELERNTELLRSYGLEVHIFQQDNGPRLISIRQLKETAVVDTQEGQPNSSRIGDADEKVVADEVMNADRNEPGWQQQAEEHSGTEEQALGDSADLRFESTPGESTPANVNATPPGVRANSDHHPQQQSISISPDLSESSDWHDIRTSLSGFDTGNTVSTGIAHRMIITGIVILCVVGVLFFCAWIWPGSFPIELFGDGTAQSNPALQRSRTQESD
ncbi:MAG: hypothetical protein JWN45_2086, partial [Acidobacteriaceae bacterium]|nr:hypothetical protein [Acidobacteriaceae bacterium]